VDQLCVWDYVTLGNYSKHDDLDLLDYTSPEWKTVSKVFDVFTRGTNVSALINFRLCNPTSSLYKNGAHREIIRNYDGSPHTESFPLTHHHAAPFAHGSGRTRMCAVRSPRATGRACCVRPGNTASGATPRCSSTSL